MLVCKEGSFLGAWSTTQICDVGGGKNVAMSADFCHVGPIAHRGATFYRSTRQVTERPEMAIVSGRNAAASSLDTSASIILPESAESAMANPVC